MSRFIQVWLLLGLLLNTTSSARAQLGEADFAKTLVRAHYVEGLPDAEAASLVGRHVLIIGLDGVRADSIQAANTPNIDALISNGAVTYNAFAGGVLGQPSQQATVSGPGWSSILTGVWVDKHNVSNNSFSGRNFVSYPHLFSRIKQGDAGAYLSSFASWPEIHTYILSDDDYRYTASSGSYAVRDAELTTA